MELRETVDGMLSDNYKERFVAEFQQVVIRGEKLEKILVKYKNDKLDFTPDSSIGLLFTQAHILGAYMGVLVERANQEGIELTIELDEGE